MATFTASTLENQSLSRAPGVHVRYFDTGTGRLIGSAGDVLLLCRVPNQAYILDIAFNGRAGGAGNPSCIFHLRYPHTSLTATVLSPTLSATLNTRSILQAGYPEAPVKVSISADSTFNYAILAASIIPGNSGSGTLTATTSFSFKGYVTLTWSL